MVNVLNSSYIYIPFLYFLKTRLNSKFNKVAWLFTYFIPLFILTFFSDSLSSLSSLLSFFISIIIVNYAYEDGYIYNDAITTINEKKPTLRLPISSIVDIRNNYKKIVVTRFLIATFLLFVIYIISGVKEFLVSLSLYVVINVIYIIYNNTRSILNLYLILPLSFFRFYGPLFVVLPIYNYNLYILPCILLYPLSKFLEFSSRERFKIKLAIRLINDFNYFRLLYYFLTSVLFSILFFFDSKYFPFLLTSLFYFLYRILGVLILKKDKAAMELIKNNHKKHSK